MLEQKPNGSILYPEQLLLSYTAVAGASTSRMFSLCVTVPQNVLLYAELWLHETSQKVAHVVSTSSWLLSIRSPYLNLLANTWYFSNCYRCVTEVGMMCLQAVPELETATSSAKFQMRDSSPRLKLILRVCLRYLSLLACKRKSA